MIREIYLNKLPKKYGTGKNKNKLVIDWMKSVDYKVRFIYNNIEDDIKIINYISKGQKLIVEYKNKTFNISTSHFINCKLGGKL